MLLLLGVVVRLARGDLSAGTGAGETAVRGTVGDVRLREDLLRAVLRVLGVLLRMLLLLLVGIVGRLLLVALVVRLGLGLLLLLLLCVGVLGRSAVAVRWVSAHVLRQPSLPCWGGAWGGPPRSVSYC